MAKNNFISPDNVEPLFDVAVRLNRNPKALEAILLDAGVRVYEIKAGGRSTKLVDREDLTRWLSANVELVGDKSDPLEKLEKRLELLGKEIERIFGQMSDLRALKQEVQP